jgi:hypothetical protein
LTIASLRCRFGGDHPAPVTLVVRRRPTHIGRSEPLLEHRYQWWHYVAAASEYVGLCAELPSLSWLEKTPERALTGIRQLAPKIPSRI